MSKKRKLFVFDLDGTLLTSESHLSKANLAALEAAKAKGHLLAVATGRNYEFTQLVLKDYWPMFDYYLGCNGALLHDLNQQTHWYASKAINPDLIDYLTKKLATIGGGIQVSTTWKVYTQLFLAYENQSFLNHTKKCYFDGWPAIATMSPEERATIAQVSIHVDPEIINEIALQIRADFAHLYAVTITSNTNIDINIKPVTKLFGIQEIVRRENLEENQVYVFGDSENDIPSLSYYDHSFATANGLEDTKQAAKTVIGSNNTDAIAKVVWEAL